MLNERGRLVMKIMDNIHLIRNEFHVTPEVKRYVNIYLLTGENCYLIDSGVSGSAKIIEEYMHSIGRKLSDIKGIFLTHSHPDHIGGAAEIKSIAGVKVYAPKQELNWIENIDMQYKERPIPNFYKLLSKSVVVDRPLSDGNVISLEVGLQIRAVGTPGHSHGSMSFVLNDTVIFTGDAIPVTYDLPIFVDYEQSVQSLDRISELSNIQYICPAWDEVYDKEKLPEVIHNSKDMLKRLRSATVRVEKECSQASENEKLLKILGQVGMLQYIGNPLVERSIYACKKVL